MKGFNVTYEIVTPESAEFGDAEERGFISQDMSLRDALGAWNGIGCHVEADCWPVGTETPPTWFTAYKVQEDYTTCAEESRGLHIPDNVTVSSRLRIACLVGCYGLKLED